MRRVIVIVGVVALLGVASGALAQSSERGIKAPTYDIGPRSLYELDGSYNDAAEFNPDGPDVLIQSNGTPLNFATPTTQLRTLDGRYPVTECAVLTYAGGTREMTIFDQTVTPTATTNRIEIEYNAQTGINAGTRLNGVALNCTVTQGAFSVPCPGTVFKPFMIRRDLTSFDGNIGMTSYHGTTGTTDTATPIRVVIKVEMSATSLIGDQMSVCDPYFHLEW